MVLNIIITVLSFLFYHGAKDRRKKRRKCVEEKKRDGFFELYGISPAQEELFKVIYRRRQIYRGIIAVETLIIAVLIVLLCLR